MTKTSNFQQSGGSTEWVVLKEPTIRVETDSSIVEVATARQRTTEVSEDTIGLVSIGNDDPLEGVCLKKKNAGD